MPNMWGKPFKCWSFTFKLYHLSHVSSMWYCFGAQFVVTAMLDVLLHVCNIVQVSWHQYTPLSQHSACNILNDSWCHHRVFPLLPEIQQKLRIQIMYHACPIFWGDYCIHIYMHCKEPMKAVSSHGSCGYCYLWWRWRSDTLWATLTRLWLNSVSC